MRQPAENRPGRSGACASPAKRQTVGSRRSPPWRGEAYFVGPFYSAGGLRRDCGKETTQTREWDKHTQRNDRAGNDVELLRHGSFPPCFFPQFHPVSSYDVGSGTTSDAVEPEVPARPASTLCDEASERWTRWIGGLPIRGRVALLWTEKCSLYRVLVLRTLHRELSCILPGGDLVGPGFPIEKKRRKKTLRRPGSG